MVLEYWLLAKTSKYHRYEMVKTDLVSVSEFVKYLKKIKRTAKF